MPSWLNIFVIMKYEEAIQKLETIARNMENGEMGVDELAENITEAKKLISFCRAQLTEVDEKIEKILSALE
ncbi:MAG: exodeoxyribonuclease VII small subunit [Bacteroidaceae bacterium]|nr:exodeoxyribonuclease VII small subunit [Bacteroidaceae bacterium]